MPPTDEIPEYLTKNPRAVKAWPGWLAVRDLLHLREWGYGVEAADRVRRAGDALREFRYATNTQRASNEEVCLAVRVAAAAFADEIAAHAHEHDDQTIRWVLAGLRCRSQPFCTGCRSCQTVTSPERVTVGSD